LCGYACNSATTSGRLVESGSQFCMYVKQAFRTRSLSRTIGGTECAVSSKRAVRLSSYPSCQWSLGGQGQKPVEHPVSIRNGAFGCQQHAQKYRVVIKEESRVPGPAASASSGSSARCRLHVQFSPIFLSNHSMGEWSWHSECG